MSLEQNHTTGKWTYDGRVSICRNGNTLPSGIIALVYSCADGGLEPNARIISAAPDMLDALLEAREALAVSLAWPQSDAIRRKIDAAIYKATGGAK
jgi:O-acetyl-ADP-ribose deacetylase (regulator of RNase III)